MKLAIYSTKQYDKKYLQQVNEAFGFELEFFDFLLTEKTAKTAHGCEAVCIFVNDDGSRPVLEELKKHGVKYIALRCAGFNNVDLDAAKELGLQVVRVPAYSPEAVAEHAIGMMMTLNRRIHRAYQRTRDANFSLEGLTGFTMYGKTAGVIGTGKIGVAALRILKGFGMRLLAFDPYPSAAALELWRDELDGAVVAIGNAPTALFHLLNMLADPACPRPAAIIGCPVGFVGAAESKAALIAAPPVPALIVRGRLGGSANTLARCSPAASGFLKNAPTTSVLACLRTKSIWWVYSRTFTAPANCLMATPTV